MRLKFSMGATLNNAVDTSSGQWITATLTLAVADSEGVFIGTDVAVGDSVWLDTGAFEPGTMTQYKIRAVGPCTASSMIVTVGFVTTDHAAPDLSFVIGARAVVTRAGGGLAPVLSPSVQQIPDKFSFYLLNANTAAVAPANVSITTRDGNGRVTGWSTGGVAYTATYGANGLIAVTKGGQPYMTVTYTSGAVSLIAYE